MSPTEKQRIDPGAIRKILLIRLRRIGDVVMTTPAITILREHCPEAEITYIVDEPYRELVEEHPALDNVLVLPVKLGAGDFLRHIRPIRKNRFDVLIDFHGGPRAFLITLLSKARLKIGYRIKYKHFLYDIRIPREPEEGLLHSVESHTNLVNALGILPTALPPLTLPPGKPLEAEKIQRILRRNKAQGYKIIALHIGAGNEFRNWGADRIIALTNLAASIPGVKIILIGSQEDRAAEQEILHKSSAPLISLVSRLKLRELRELLAISSLFVGSDSGPMHIAASAEIPIVALFGPTLPAHFSPWRARATLLEKDFDCRPCRQRECVHDDFRCLRSISPQEVFQACLPYLRSETNFAS